MFASNPFAELDAFLPVGSMRIYVIIMVIAVVAGTLLDAWHKGSATYFAQRKAHARAAAKRSLSRGTAAALAVQTVAEAAVSGEFCKWPRRLSHLLMMYGFVLYIISTVLLVFFYHDAAATPRILPALWDGGALMILLGALWFFFFLRVNVAYEGDSRFSVGRADLFVLSLIGSAAFALIWHWAQSATGNAPGSLVLFGLYIAFTTLLFGSVFWSKFAHMFYKPIVAFQRRVEEASGSTDLPTPNIDRHCRS